MLELRVKKLHPDAKLPICANPGSDLAYDVFAVDDVMLCQGYLAKVKTGIAVQLDGYGFLIRDRSSMAAKGIVVTGGVIDAGYRGEVIVMLPALSTSIYIRNDDKIAQLIPVRPATTFPVIECDILDSSIRGEAGFGSTGR
jgi:dUTP pyrophosphatase